MTRDPTLLSGSSNEPKHEAGTALQAGPGRSAFLAWCVCGWQGHAHQTDADALNEAQAHVMERVREGFELLADLAQTPRTWKIAICDQCTEHVNDCQCHWEWRGAGEPGTHLVEVQATSGEDRC